VYQYLQRMARLLRRRIRVRLVSKPAQREKGHIGGLEGSKVSSTCQRVKESIKENGSAMLQLSRAGIVVATFSDRRPGTCDLLKYTSAHGHLGPRAFETTGPLPPTIHVFDRANPPCVVRGHRLLEVAKTSGPGALEVTGCVTVAAITTPEAFVFHRTGKPKREGTLRHQQKVGLERAVVTLDGRSSRPSTCAALGDGVHTNE
jgi:hypothetical protein